MILNATSRPDSTYCPAVGQRVVFWYGHYRRDRSQKNPRGKELRGTVVGVQLRDKRRDEARPHLFIWVPQLQQLKRCWARNVIRVLGQRPRRRGMSHQKVWIRREIALNCGETLYYAMKQGDPHKNGALVDLLDRPIVFDAALRRRGKRVHYVEVLVHRSWAPALQDLHDHCRELLARVEAAVHDLRAYLPVMAQGQRKGVDLRDRFSYDGRPLTKLVDRLNRPPRARPANRADTSPPTGAASQ
jgi:hypothetical protein